MSHFLELLFVGLLAGFEIGVHYGLVAPPSNLPEDAQIIYRQALVLRLRFLSPSIFFPTLLLAVWVAVQDRHESEPWLRYSTVILLLIWIVVRTQTVPVNSATLDWNPLSPPKKWRSLVERTERFHLIAARAVVAAFLCSLTSTCGPR